MLDVRPSVLPTQQTLTGSHQRWSSRLFSNRVISVLLGGLVLAVFQPVLRHGFINLDDFTYVVGNYHVQAGLTKQSLLLAFKRFQGANWHPLTWIAHMLDCQLFGLDPAGHHLTSALIHAVNSVLLFLFLKSATGAVWRSLAVAAIFGL